MLYFPSQERKMNSRLCWVWVRRFDPQILPRLKLNQLDQVSQPWPDSVGVKASEEVETEREEFCEEARGHTKHFATSLFPQSSAEFK